ncbi:MAG: glycosyltransferase family 2 protein [Pseudomonadota bacterium]
MSWGTVTLADEPIELLLAFAAWHRELGASEIHIFLDRPSQRGAEALSAVPGVIVTNCDELFWAANGGRHALQTKRQEVVANFAYAEAQVDWLAHIDADEFIYSDGGFEDELAAIPDPVHGAILPVRERVWEVMSPPETLFEGLFRIPIPGKPTLNRYVAGVTSRYLYRGLACHTKGKSIVRTGQGIAMGIHTPLLADDLNLMEAQSAKMLHFDGVTPYHWLVKRLKYAALPHAETSMGSDNYRWAQIAALREFATLWEARRFQRQLTALRPEKIAQLEALRLLERIPAFSPEKALARILPGQEISLGNHRFDRRIARRDKSFVEALSLEPEPQQDRAASPLPDEQTH